MRGKDPRSLRTNRDALLGLNGYTVYGRCEYADCAGFSVLGDDNPYPAPFVARLLPVVAFEGTLESDARRHETSELLEECEKTLAVAEWNEFIVVVVRVHEAVECDRQLADGNCWCR